MRKNIAVFNNATGIIENMQALFTGEGLQMYKASDLDELIRLLKSDCIHLILVDLELDGSGMGYEIETIRYIRKCTSVPIIVVTSQTSETAKIVSLNMGADDYVTVNDNPLVVLARVKAQLRRYTELMNMCVNLDNIYRVEDIEVDDRNHTVRVGGRNVKMTPIEYKILRLLIQEKGKVLSINQIYENIWQMQPIGAENIVAVHIRHIREKIERNPKDPHYLKVVWGLGYKVG